MTHGDKAKAKTGGKSSQTSAVKKSSSPTKEAGSQGAAGKGSGKGAPPGAAKAEGKAGGGKIVIKKAGAEKGNGAPAGKAAGKEGGGGGGKSVKGPAEDAGSFSNPAVANAFKHAVKKYPNAFRKLTD